VRQIKATQHCRCGCVAASHTRGVFVQCDDTESATLEDIQTKFAPGHNASCSNHCTRFELDNLTLIEYLAEERGLV
jgi:hypothetical protein